MKKMNSLLKYFMMLTTVFLLWGCVHDDKYDEPNLDGFQCGELASTITIAEVKAKLVDASGGKYYKFPDDSQDVLEGYVSSSDETGNIYKYIYIQDSPENPTEGFTISVNSLNNYTRYPQGSKIYIKLKGLAVGTYGSVKQLGAEVFNNKTGNLEFTRIPENQVYTSILRSCANKVTIIPKVMTLAQMVSANDQYLGCLIQVDNAEFDSKSLCSIYAPAGQTVDRVISDNSTSTTRIVRNSGYASFANQLVPAGNGKFVGIYSKYNSTYQMYIVRASDLEMNNFPRIDGLTADPCVFDPTGLTVKTVAEVKQLLSSGNLTHITGDFYLKAAVTVNDESANLFNSLYIEDATGGIRLNVSKANSATKSALYQDPRFKVGKSIIVKLKDLYVGKYFGEFQIGMPNGSNIGYIPEADIYKYFFGTNETVTTVPTEKRIKDFTSDDVGKWVKIKDVQVTEGDLFKTYAEGGTTNRTLEDCDGNKILLRTRKEASFSGKELDSGKGDIYAILSVYNGTYQLLLPFQKNADFDHARCDGTVPKNFETLFSDGFADLSNWTAVNVLGAREWTTTTYGNPAPSAYIDGNRQANEDWLISKKISLVGGYTDAFFSFETDARYSGNALEVYVTDNYTGTVSTTNWTKVNPILDEDLSAFAGFVSSGRVSLSSFLNKDVVVAFKYTSVSGASTTYEVDNFTVKVTKD